LNKFFHKVKVLISLKHTNKSEGKLDCNLRKNNSEKLIFS
jgi:hypothetical protein